MICNVRGETYALQGVLWSYRGAWLTLREPALLVPNELPKRQVGEAVIHRDQITYLQVLPQVQP